MAPEAVVRALRKHRHLGIHSGMFNDALMDLVRCGAAPVPARIGHVNDPTSASRVTVATAGTHVTAKSANRAI